MQAPKSSAKYFLGQTCKGDLRFDDDPPRLSDAKSGAAFHYQDGVWCFLQGAHYTQSFGFQWNQHSRTQIDKFNGLNISEERFYRQTGWRKSFSCDFRGRHWIVVLAAKR